MPDRWIPAVVEYASCLCYRRMNDGDNADMCQKAYDRWITRARANGDLKAMEEGGGVDLGSKSQMEGDA